MMVPTTIDRYNHELFVLGHFVDLCLAGLKQGAEATAHLELSRKIAKTLHRPDPLPTDSEREKALDTARKYEAFAKAQHDLGFPYLFGIAAIKIWSLLEGGVDELVVAQLRLRSLPPGPAVARIKGPLVDFMNATDDERAEILLEKLKEATEATLKRGCGRFETLLDAVGLGGPVDDAPRKALLELSEVRNVLVHRNATADRRFALACPWFGAEAGGPVNLVSNHYKMYEFSAFWYFLELDRRLTALAGQQSPSDQLELQHDLAGKVAEFLESRHKESAAVARPGPSGV